MRGSSPNARNGQAALYDALRAALLDDLGVDQLDHLLRVLVDVEEHDDAAQDADLRGGKADAARVFQRLAHIVDQYMQAVVELFDRTAVRILRSAMIIYPPNSAFLCRY